MMDRDWAALDIGADTDDSVQNTYPSWLCNRGAPDAPDVVAPILRTGLSETRV